MIKDNKLIEFISNKNKRFSYLAAKGFYNYLSDEKYLKRMFKIHIGKELDLDCPQTYNEKLQWLKLYDRRPEYTIMVDKYAVKKYVSDIIGSQYIIPTLGVWDSFDDIKFEKLPNQFVLKCTHDSGGLVICKDKLHLDIENARRRINKSLKRNYYKLWREWPYKNVKPRIIAEKFMFDEKAESDSPILDYKFYTFNGTVKIVMINTDRGNGTKADYFDRNYNWLDFTWGYPHAKEPPRKPLNFDLMISLAEKLASQTPELRVDFYEVNGKVYFGELTFFDGSGFDRITPYEWDIKMGEWISLPEKRG